MLAKKFLKLSKHLLDISNFVEFFKYHFPSNMYWRR